VCEIIFALKVKYFKGLSIILLNYQQCFTHTNIIIIIFEKRYGKKIMLFELIWLINEKERKKITM